MRLVNLFGLCGAVLSALLCNGCGGPLGGCGVGPVYNADAGTQTASVGEDGTVRFSAIVAGTTTTFAMPVKDSADTDETIVTADISGDDPSVFSIDTSLLPLAIPAGQSVDLTVTFAPTTTGNFDATLTLHTEKMGPSPITLAGSATP